MKMSKFGTVQVGYDFECEKNNGKKYAGQIVKVAAYTKGTLVTICYYESDAYQTSHGEWVEGSSPVHKSIYLEDCKVWYTEDLAPQY
jgi:hypothetical protein